MKSACLIFSLISLCASHGKEIPKTSIPFISQIEAHLDAYQSPVPETFSQAVRELISHGAESQFGADFLAKIAEAENNSIDGEYIEKWGNGQIKFCGSFQNKFAEGHIHGWYSDGRDAFKGYFKNGIKAGIHITFLPSGPRVHSNAHDRVLAFDEKGRLDGDQWLNDPDDHFKAYVHYAHGVREGKAEMLDAESKNYYYVMYKKGQGTVQRSEHYHRP
jgi:hypothetical protein